MKLKHDNLTLIEDWLKLSNQSISFDDDFVRQIYRDVLERHFNLNVSNRKQRIRGYKLQYDFIRRDLLKLKYKQNGYSANGITEGFVYAIGNPAWCEYTKIGSAIDVYDRLNSYQTASPFRDYFLIDYYFVRDRLKEEQRLHYMFYEDRLSEWCKITNNDIKVLFKELRKQHQVLTFDEI